MNSTWELFCLHPQFYFYFNNTVPAKKEGRPRRLARRWGASRPVLGFYRRRAVAHLVWWALLNRFKSPCYFPIVVGLATTNTFYELLDQGDFLRELALAMKLYAGISA